MVSNLLDKAVLTDSSLLSIEERISFVLSNAIKALGSFCSNIIIANLGHYHLGHYPSITCFHTLSVAHLSIPNDAGNIQIIICLMHQESNA